MMPASTESPQKSGTGRLKPPPSVEEQRTEIRQLLALRPADTYLRQALVRLIGPQHVKQAAREGVFISYTRADELFAAQLADDLRTRGISVWLDLVDIPDDADWHEAVTAGLEGCGLMLLILSPAALEDADLKEEYQQFLNAGKIVVPVLHQTCKFESPLIVHQFVDFRHDYKLGLTILGRLLS
jgi:hypothetical protein